MARMNWEKVRAAQQWDTYVRKAPKPGPRPVLARAASEKQKDYIQGLLKKAGRRAFSADELDTLTIDSASRLIKDLTVQAPVK